MIKSGLLEQLRKAKGLTLLQMGEYLGVSHMSYQRYEKGENDVSTDTLSKLADLFGVSSDYLLGRTEIKQPAYMDPVNALGIDDSEAYSTSEFENAYEQLPEPLKIVVWHTIKEIVDISRSSDCTVETIPEPLKPFA